MAQKRKPLEFSDPYDEDVSGMVGGSSWMQRGLTKSHTDKTTRQTELKEIDKLLLNEGKCPSCGSISQDYVSLLICPDCGYQE